MNICRRCNSEVKEEDSVHIELAIAYFGSSVDNEEMLFHSDCWHTIKDVINGYSSDEVL